MTDPEPMVASDAVAAAEHLWLRDLRRHPTGEVRLCVDGRLVSGTAAYQVTGSINEMLAAERAKTTALVEAVEKAAAKITATCADNCTSAGCDLQDAAAVVRAVLAEHGAQEQAGGGE